MRDGGRRIRLNIDSPRVARISLGARENSVVQLHQTIVESFDLPQLQRHLTVTACYQWNTVADEHRHHADDEFVDRLLVEKGRDELAPAHQPDILAGLCPKLPNERANWLVGPLSP